MARRKTSKKLKIIFVDEVNDLQSQIAEHFLRDFLIVYYHVLIDVHI